MVIKTTIFTIMILIVILTLSCNLLKQRSIVYPPNWPLPFLTVPVNSSPLLRKKMFDQENIYYIDGYTESHDLGSVQYTRIYHIVFFSTQDSKDKVVKHIETCLNNTKFINTEKESNHSVIWVNQDTNQRIVLTYDNDQYSLSIVTVIKKSDSVHY